MIKKLLVIWSDDQKPEECHYLQARFQAQTDCAPLREQLEWLDDELIFFHQKLLGHLNIAESSWQLSLNSAQLYQLRGFQVEALSLLRSLVQPSNGRIFCLPLMPLFAPFWQPILRRLSLDSVHLLPCSDQRLALNPIELQQACALDRYITLLDLLPADRLLLLHQEESDSVALSHLVEFAQAQTQWNPSRGLTPALHLKSEPIHQLWMTVVAYLSQHPFASCQQAILELKAWRQGHVHLLESMLEQRRLRLQGEVQSAQQGLVLGRSYLQRIGQAEFQLVQHSTGYVPFAHQRSTYHQACEPSLAVIIYHPGLPSHALSLTLASVVPHLGDQIKVWVLGTDPALKATLQQWDARLEYLNASCAELQSNAALYASRINQALEQIDTDYVMLLQSGDLLSTDAAALYIEAVKQQPADVIYADEDRVSAQQVMSQPMYKPDWSPDFLLVYPYLGRAIFWRRARILAVGGLEPVAIQDQLWDLALRCEEDQATFVRLTELLLHSAVPSLRGYLAPTVIERALARRQLSAQVMPLRDYPHLYRVDFYPATLPLVSIIIPSRDNKNLLEGCIDSIYGLTQGIRFEIIVVDNGSVDSATLSYLKNLQEQDQAKVVRHDAPFNFSELNNKGVEIAQGELLLFLNDDTQVLMSDWLVRLAGQALLPHRGLVGAKLIYADQQTTQHGGVANLTQGPCNTYARQPKVSAGYFYRHQLNVNWFSVTGACMMIRRSLFAELGGFDEQLPVAYNDIDICIKALKKGLYNLVDQSVELVHFESQSRGEDMASLKKQQRLKKELRYLWARHPEFYEYDPFGHPALHPYSHLCEPLSL